jgi:hypothetical protein
MPAGLASFFSGVNAGDSLAAADQANWLAQFWAQGVVAHQAGVASDRPYVSGGFVFEFRDEWWKSLSPTFQNISGPPDTCTQCPCQPNGNPSAANTVFPGGWGDEEWFGMTAAKVNPNRCPARGKCTPGQGQNTDPVINVSNGSLNGGPDILRPRAAIVALCKAYKGSGCP